jgi:hypothetical protein
MTRPLGGPFAPPALLRAGIDPEARRWIASAADSVLAAPGFKTHPGDVVDGHVARQLPFLTGDQLTITAAAILHTCFQQTQAKAGISADAVFSLQQAMEQKAQLETMISNVMKTAAETADALASSVKD